MPNQQFFHPDPPVAGNPSQETNPAEGAPEASAPTGYEIAGERYTEEQIEAALGGLEAVQAAQKDSEAAYYRQTRDVAAKRREVEEMEERAKALLAQAENEYATPDPLDETVPGLGSKFKTIEQKIDQLTRAQEAEAQSRVQRDAATEREDAMATAIDSLQGRPYVNDDKAKAEIRAYMAQNNLGPEHVGMAYNAMYGPQIGEQRGFQRAVREGASAGPPTMGAGEQSISPGFTTPNEAPGAEVDVSQDSWSDTSKRALNDPDKPNFG